jgi:DNA uptake protein ComE-like DNA-binding protein
MSNLHRLGWVPALAVLLSLAATLAIAQVGHNTDLLDPNLAGVEELAALPGVDDELAATIVAARPYLDIEDLHAVLSASLNDEELEGLYRRLWVPLDLNTASRASILHIPGVGPRLAHEFEEYRPYHALVQFHRQIGKYVDDAEVARLEQYVFVPLGLNTATPEDFLTIPGVGERMVHELMEYRPYTSLVQFRREIGKYVDDDEVARLERYLALD